MRERRPFRPPVRLAVTALAAIAFSLGAGRGTAAAAIITNLTVNDAANAADWSAQTSLATGNVQYGDRAFTFTNVGGLAGAEWIRGANDSKAFTGATLLTFTVSADADVYVAHNDSIGTKPSWLSAANGWSDSGSNLVNNESSPKTFSLFRKTFTANSTVSLGNNGSTSASHYSVVVKPAGPVIGGNGPVLPPKWVFGVLFGSYYNQALVLDAMTRLRSGGYGGDLLWVDSSWLSNEYNDPPKYINFRFDSGQFPDARGMIETLNANHFRFGVWQWPYIDKSNSLYATGERNGYFIKNSSGDVVDGGGWHGVTFTGQIDFTNPASRNWWKSLNQPLVDMGVEFFKIDTYSTVASGGRLFDGTTSTNNLREQYHKTVYEVSQARSGGRGFILAHRQSSPNNDQYPGLWTGDIGSNWAGFAEATKRAAAFNTSTTTPYWTGDTGGYNGGEPTDELYIRWLQFGAFSPVNEFFAQKSSKTRFPWKFGAQAQQIFKTYMRLRYRLLPFRYSNAQIAFHETPVKYPVRFVSGRTDEIIVGNGASEILVAPIQTEGATSGDAHLPSGKSWIHYWTGSVHAGGSTPTVAAPLDRVPMFVKAGSIIPMGPDLEWVDQRPADPLTLDIYPSGATSYTLYEDDGVSLAYQTGAFSKTVLSCNDAGGNVTVSIGAASGTYTGKLTERTYVLKVNQQATDPGAVIRDGSTVTRRASRAEFDAADEGWFYDSAAKIVWVKFRISTSVATAVVL